MKKLYTMLMMAMMALAFTSCEDEAIAYDLAGTWGGEMRISTSYDGYVYNSTYTEITFDKNPYEYAQGTGTWVDYYSNAPWDYVANHITWEVNNRVIRVWFRNEGTYFEIRDYSLNSYRFQGTIWDNGNYVEFYLTKIASPNYYNYHWDTYYVDPYWSDPYWSRTRSAADSTGVDTTATKDAPVRFVNPK